MALTTLVTACEPIGAIDQATVCAGWKEIEGEPGDADVISDRLALSIAGHQEYGRSLGCW